LRPENQAAIVKLCILSRGAIMIKSINISNFRSIEKAAIDLAPITVLYGPTASGKSSAFYAALALRNFVLNPNQTADSLFNLGFISLGGFDECVFNHERRWVKVSVKNDDDGEESWYTLALWKTSAELSLSADTIKLKGKVDVPYALNSTFPLDHTKGDNEYVITWTGVNSTVAPKAPTAETQKTAQEMAAMLNEPMRAIKAIDISPAKRGFFKPSYSPSQVSTTPTSEDEVASLIINDPHMAARISTYTEEIFGRDFRLYTAPGTATVFFQSTDKQSKTPGLLVNDGFGVNQVVYLFAKMHRPEVETILIEEPEVHLHPTALRNLARALCNFAIRERKQLVFTTHSDFLVQCILAVVVEGDLQPEDMKCYHSTKQGRCTLFEEQKVNSKGQLEGGGLSSFVETEYGDIRRLLAAEKE
jgi:hypothetical protein